MGRAIHRGAFVVAWTGLGVGWGCSAQPSKTVPPPAAETRSEPVKPPETAFAELERRLQRGPLHLRFEVSAEGAVEVGLRGELRVGPRVELSARGQFGGEDHELHMWTRGDRLLAGPADAPVIDMPRPVDLEPALILGLTRMGVLHNLAMLVGGAPPDHADGGVQDWVRTVEHRRPSPPPSRGDAVSFGLVVEGQPSGEATLWLDDHGRPVRREQTVDFPDGQMRVVERYEVLESALGLAAG